MSTHRRRGSVTRLLNTFVAQDPAGLAEPPGRYGFGAGDGVSAATAGLAPSPSAALEGGAIVQGAARSLILDALNSSISAGLTAPLLDDNLLLLVRVYKQRKEDLFYAGKGALKDLVGARDEKARFLALVSVAAEDAAAGAGARGSMRMTISMTANQGVPAGQLYYLVVSNGAVSIKANWMATELTTIEVEAPADGEEEDPDAEVPLTLYLSGVANTWLISNAEARDEVLVSLLQACELVFMQTVTTRGVDVSGLMGRAHDFLRRNHVLLDRLGLAGEITVPSGLDPSSRKSIAASIASEAAGNPFAAERSEERPMAEEERAATRLLNSYNWTQQHVPTVEKAIVDKLEALEYDTVKFLLAWEPREAGGAGGGAGGGGRRRSSGDIVRENLGGVEAGVGAESWAAQRGGGGARRGAARTRTRTCGARRPGCSARCPRWTWSSRGCSPGSSPTARRWTRCGAR